MLLFAAPAKTSPNPFDEFVFFLFFFGGASSVVLLLKNVDRGGGTERVHHSLSLFKSSNTRRLQVEYAYITSQPGRLVMPSRGKNTSECP